MAGDNRHLDEATAAGIRQYCDWLKRQGRQLEAELGQLRQTQAAGE